MATNLEKTATPGIFRRHAKGCDGGRCDCPYVVVWRHRGKQHKETHRTYADAREAKGNREAGDRRPATRVRFDEYFQGWIASYTGRTARGFSETSRREYRREIEQHAVPRWGTWRLADIEPTDARELFGAMRQSGAGSGTVKRVRAALSAMFGTAVEDGLIRSNPVRGVRIPADPEEAGSDSVKALTRSELAALLDAIPEERRLLFEFLAHTGLRIGEAAGLTWAHLDLGEPPRVRVREQYYKGERKGLKSGSGRRDVPLSPGMAGKLLAHRRDHYRAEDAPVFARRGGREFYGANVSRHVLKPAAESVGLGWVTFHTFRHTCASMLFEAGRNVKQVQEWLGHADASFTLRRYVHLMDAGIGDAEFLDHAVGGNTKATQRPETAANRTDSSTPKKAD